MGLHGDDQGRDSPSGTRLAHSDPLPSSRTGLSVAGENGIFQEPYRKNDILLLVTGATPDSTAL